MVELLDLAEQDGGFGRYLTYDELDDEKPHKVLD